VIKYERKCEIFIQQHQNQSNWQIMQFNLDDMLISPSDEGNMEKAKIKKIN
jgi:hypothetical protein